MPKSSLEITDNKGLFALFKGKPGTGKSNAAFSFPGVYVFDFDRKMPSIVQKHFPGKDVHWDTFDDIFVLSTQMAEFLKDCPYETLVFDSVTTLSTTFLNSIAKVKGESVMSMLSNVVIPKGGGNKTIETLGIDYYNGETSFFERFIVEVGSKLYAKQGNPKHIIFLAHVLTTESAPDLKTKVVTTTNSIVTAGRKAATMIEKAFDNTFYFGISIPQSLASFSSGSTQEKTKRLCFTEPHGQDMARCSYSLPAVIDFTDKNFYDEINKVCKWS